MKGEKLVSWIKNSYENARFTGIELAKVTQVEPDIEIKVDGMEQTLGASFLVIPSRFIESEVKLSGDWQITAQTQGAQTASSGAHSHNISPIDIRQMAVDKVLAKIKYTLKPGDRVAVVPALGGKRFMILDKVVIK